MDTSLKLKKIKIKTQKCFLKLKKKRKEKKRSQYKKKKKKKSKNRQANTLTKKEKIKEKKKKKLTRWRWNLTGEVFLKAHFTSFLIFVFSSFWGENFLVGPGRKHLDPIIYFPSTIPNQVHSKKVFLSIFSPKFSIHLISPLNKHTLRCGLVGRMKKWKD